MHRDAANQRHRWHRPIEPCRLLTELYISSRTTGLPRYGHSSVFCHMPPRCIRCGGAHSKDACERSRDTTLMYCNCGGEHPASNRGCHTTKAATPCHSGLPPTPTPLQGKTKPAFASVKAAAATGNSGVSPHLLLLKHVRLTAQPPLLCNHRCL